MTPQTPIATSPGTRRSSALSAKEIRRRLLTLGAGSGRSDEFYAGWADCWDKVLDVLEIGKRR